MVTIKLAVAEMAMVAGGCNTCELNPPTAMDVYGPQPELFVDVGVNNDMRMIFM